MDRVYRAHCQRREAAIRRLVERLLGHAVPSGLEELAVLALADMGLRVELVITNCGSCGSTVFAHRGNQCVDSEAVGDRLRL